MDKHEHAARLRAAVGASTRSRSEIADYVGRTYRTLSNWMSTREPTMPTPAERALLRDLLGPYDEAGDPVEVALRHSRLVEDRQLTVLATYKRQLREQDAEEGRAVG